MTPQVPQWTARQERDDLALIPPLAEEFSVGAGEVTDRARKWALDRHYLLAAGVPKCAHGLYLFASCPGSTCRSKFRQLDHADIWVPADPKAGRPFLLAHAYSEEISDETRAYAAAHGLDYLPGRIGAGDDWYGYGTLPVCMTLPVNWPLWPIEAKVAVLLSTQPVAWPDEQEPER